MRPSATHLRQCLAAFFALTLLALAALSAPGASAHADMTPPDHRHAAMAGVAERHATVPPIAPCRDHGAPSGTCCTGGVCSFGCSALHLQPFAPLDDTEASSATATAGVRLPAIASDVIFRPPIATV